MGKRGPKAGFGGRPRKGIAEKIAEGNPGGRKLTVLSFGSSVGEDLRENEPVPSEFLTGMKGAGVSIGADEVFRQTWEWLKERECETLVSEQLIEKYAACTARWKQCEEAISRVGLIAKHPTNGNPIQSPYVSMASTYLSQAGKLWSEIYQIVRENCMKEMGSSPGDDLMEALLRKKG